MNPDSMTAFGELDAEVSVAVAEAEASKPRLGGKGIYMEFPKESGSEVTQIMITPEGFNEAGEPVHMAVISRAVSDWSPRKQWRVTFVRPQGEPVTSTSGKALGLSKQVEDILTRQMKWGLASIRKQPIVFELTDMDFSDISLWKAPASALRRIQKARVALTFPEKLVK